MHDIGDIVVSAAHMLKNNCAHPFLCGDATMVEAYATVCTSQQHWRIRGVPERVEPNTT
jgi:hypothetical protein